MPITVVTGPPGAGKTTIAGSLARRRPFGVHLITDEYYHWIVAGAIPPWMPEANQQNATVIQAISAAAARYSTGGFDVIVDGIIGPWFLEHFTAAASLGPGELRYVVLRPARFVALAAPWAEVAMATWSIPDPSPPCTPPSRTSADTKTTWSTPPPKTPPPRSERSSPASTPASSPSAPPTAPISNDSPVATAHRPLSSPRPSIAQWCTSSTATWGPARPHSPTGWPNPPKR